MSHVPALTPAHSRTRERGQLRQETQAQAASSPLARERETEQLRQVTQAEAASSPLARERETEQLRQVAQAEAASSPLSRERERARVRAQALRKSQTDAEALLWSHLRNRHFLGLKFRRQHPVAKYFADFACIDIGLVVELDGGQHAALSAVAYDERRRVGMAALGFQTVRFWDNEVLNETDAVLEQIRQIALPLMETLTPALSRTRERE